MGWCFPFFSKPSSIPAAYPHWSHASMAHHCWGRTVLVHPSRPGHRQRPQLAWLRVPNESVDQSHAIAICILRQNENHYIMPFDTIAFLMPPTFERHQNFRVPWVISLWVFGCHGLPGWLRHGRQKPLCSKGSKRVLSKPMELISHITTFDSTL